MKLKFKNFLNRFFSSAIKERSDIESIVKRIDTIPIGSKWSPLALSSIDSTMTQLSGEQIQVFLCCIIRI